MSDDIVEQTRKNREAREAEKRNRWAELQREAREATEAEQAEEERRRKEAQEQRTQAIHERRAAELENLKELRLNRWVREGGTPEEFEAVWPDIKAKILQERVEQEEQRGRAGNSLYSEF